MPDQSGDNAPIKHSITIAGHRTSLSIEAEFWQQLQKIAASENLSVAALIARIDGARNKRNLSSACRVYVLEHLQNHSKPE